MPDILGQPCWKMDRIPKTISIIAKTDLQSSHYFLASHAPVIGLRNEKTQRFLSEEELFQAIFDPSRDGVLAVVHGETGTGKSHLIQWLRLRAQVEERGNWKNVIPVLVERRSGSLRDALEQIIEQLPDGFEQYLAPVRRAISLIGENTARELLAKSMSIELGPRWIQRGRPARQGLLEDLQDTCGSPGFYRWLCRDNGTLHNTIRRLVDPSEATERESLPGFIPGDFLVKPEYHKNNSPAVRVLIDEFLDDPELVKQAIDYFDMVLPDALKDMSGLSGHQLRQVFDQIRLDLRRQGKTLALFVEDVSVLSSLDREVFNAVEPQSRTDLCKLVAVLGMTDAGRNRLAENEVDRITFLLSISPSIRSWREDPAGVNRFAARYLNTVRLGEEQVKVVAHQRRKGEDLRQSACAGCPVREPCLQTFGKVSFDGVEVGLFPFSEKAPHRLLSALNTQTQGVRQNPRGFLERILDGLLRDHPHLVSGQFPQADLAVRLEEPTYWGPFESQYCGNWTAADKDRLKFLAQAWIEAQSPIAAAEALTPFLVPLGFPRFSKSISTPGPMVARSVPKSVPTNPSPSAPALPVVLKAPGTETPAKLQEISTSMANWVKGKPLTKDGDPRELVFKFLRSALPIEDHRGLPPSVFSSLLRDKGSIFFEGQLSKPVGRIFTVNLSRSKESQDLVVALAQHEYLGKGSWDFSDGETHRRIAGTWLRKNQDSLLETFQPQVEDPQRPLRAAIHTLALAAVLRLRARLPSERVAQCQELLSPLGEKRSSLSPSLARFIDDLWAKHPVIRTWVLQELSVPQGKTGGVNFIDPRPLLQFGQRPIPEVSPDPENTPATMNLPTLVDLLPESYLTGLGQDRYAQSYLPGLKDLDQALSDERQGLRALVNSIRSVLKAYGISTLDLVRAMEIFQEKLISLLKVQKESKFVLPNPDFEAIRPRFSEVGPWKTALANASSVLESSDALAVAEHDPVPLVEVARALEVTHQHLQELHRELSTQEKELNPSGEDPLALRDNVTALLKKIAGETT